ncbi:MULTISPECIES: cyclic lactone autoinducer peptide [unclassified Paenibacillus]
MKKMAARYASAVLASCATFFVAIFKPVLHSPEIPKELK